jgi:hypothetical protein
MSQKFTFEKNNDNSFKFQVINFHEINFKKILNVEASNPPQKP